MMAQKFYQHLYLTNSKYVRYKLLIGRQVSVTTSPAPSDIVCLVVTSDRIILIPKSLKNHNKTDNYYKKTLLSVFQ